MNLQELTPDSKWYQVLPCIAEVCRFILCIGPKSVGKSHTIGTLIGKHYRITMHSGVRVEDLVGTRTIENGNIVFVPGPVYKAMDEGVPLVIEEIDQLNNEVQGQLYGLLDGKSHLILPDGRILVAKPGFKVFATSNEHPSCLPSPIQDRIECILYCDEPHPDAFDPDGTEAEKELSLRMYKRIPKTPITIDFTPRKQRTWRKLLRANVPPVVAAKAVFCDSHSEIASSLANIQSEL